jgi:trimeric autotransporter adhesin
VSGNSGTPSGDVSLVSSLPTVGVGPFSLSAGAISSQTNALPGGTYNLTAHYPGDGNFAASDSLATSVTITPESTSTTLSALTPQGAYPAQVTPDTPMVTFPGGPYGSYVYLTANVAGNSGIGSPTGVVSFTDSGPGAFTASANLNAQGNTSIYVFTLPLGAHSLSASYGADASFASSSTSTPVQFTISQASTSTAVSAAPAANGVTLTATVSTNSAGVPPTGTIAFSVNGTQVATTQATGASATFDPNSGAFIGAQALASFSDSQLTSGQYMITANYTGDANYAASTSPSTTISVQPDFQLGIQGSNVLTIATPGGTAGTTVSVADLDGFNGTVSFSCSGLPSESTCVFNPATLSSTGSTTLTVTTTAKSAALNPGLRGEGWPLALAILGTPFAALFLLPSAERRRVRMLGALVLLGLCMSCGGSGSGGGGGGGGGNAGTPAGTYSVTLTATSGSLSHTTTFTLVVQ